MKQAKKQKRASSFPKDREWFWNMAEVAIKDGHNLYRDHSKRRDALLDMLEASIPESRVSSSNNEGKGV